MTRPAGTTFTGIGIMRLRPVRRGALPSKLVHGAGHNPLGRGDVHTAHPHFPVQVWAVGKAGRTHLPYDLAALHRLANTNVQLRKV